MALQDLTPQLRTRLSRMERAVGWFVALAMVLLAFGFAYYVYTTAARKGWFLVKAPYFTYVKSAEGLRVGDPVKLMGFDAGAITDIKPMPGDQFSYNVYIEFVLKAPNFGYVWSEGSVAKVATADFLGKRVLEVTKGTSGSPSYIFSPLSRLNVGAAANLPELDKWQFAEIIDAPDGTNILVKPKDTVTPERLAEVAAAGRTEVLLMDTRQTRKTMTGIYRTRWGYYDPFIPGAKDAKYELICEETPAVTEQLQAMVAQVQQAIPNILSLTNPLNLVLSNTVVLTSNLNLVALEARPALSNVSAATANLDHPGALGEWLLPTNLNYQLEGTLTNANLVLVGANSNLNTVTETLNRSLESLAGITSNLNRQVEANTNLVSAISSAIVHADEFVQGLKRHWLFRRAFRNTETNAPPPPPQRPVRSPKDESR
jgi:hypothetical protein